MDNQKLSAALIAKMDGEYQEFLDKLALLEKEQAKLIKDYRTKLEQKKLQQLRDDLHTV